MAQVVETEVFHPCPLQRRVPRRVGHVRPQGLAFLAEAVAQVLPNLTFQYLNRIFIQQHPLRRSVLGLIQPGIAPIQIRPVPESKAKNRWGRKQCEK